jgi:DNA modification methylase
MQAELLHETWPIERLIEYDRNPRKNEVNDAVNRVASAIREYGFRVPVIAKSDGTVVDGHLRLKAARKLGLMEIPIVLADDMTDAQVKAFRISVNKMAELAEWDEELLALEFKDLEDMDFDLELTGFSLDEIEALDFDDDETEGLTDADEVPELQDEPVSKLGDLWICGRHRVLCGDSTSITDVERLMDGKKADVLLTDPPYGIKRDKGFGGFGGFGTPIARRQYADDWDNVRPGKECFDLLLALAKKSLIFGGNYFADQLPQGKHWIVWDKQNTMPTFGDAELIWTNVERDSVKIKVFQYNGLLGKESERFHPTQKPVGLLTELIEEYTKQNETILDFFLGSGSTLIAAEKTNQICYGLEISPHYVDVICQRFSNFTGLQPTLESTGQTFNEVKEAMSG